ncbi:unnamed protein product, partial [Closterium sp. NIES-54]
MSASQRSSTRSPVSPSPLRTSSFALTTPTISLCIPNQVGLPNVGKSTLFNTLTKLSIPAENFPFCTINPNEARVNVPDERFDWLCQLFKPKSE